MTANVSSKYTTESETKDKHQGERYHRMFFVSWWYNGIVL
jgi:hypothetical protein